MVWFHSVQGAMHTGSLSHLQRRHILICHFIQSLHIAADWQGKPYHTDMLWLKVAGGRCTYTHALKTTLFQAAPPTYVLPFPAVCAENPQTNSKTATTAGVGRVQLNFMTAGRDQRWKSIFCSYTRLASIIQWCVLLGDLAPSLSSSRSHSLTQSSCPQHPTPVSLPPCSWRSQ